MKRTFKLDSVHGPGSVTWEGNDKGLGGRITVEGGQAIKKAVGDVLTPDSRTWFAPDLGGGFSGFDPRSLRHVEEGLRSMAYGKSPVLKSDPNQAEPMKSIAKATSGKPLTAAQHKQRVDAAKHRYHTSSVLGGAYRGNEAKALLTHLVRRDDSGWAEKAMCGSVKRDNLSDASGDDVGHKDAPTCPKCKEHYDKLVPHGLKLTSADDVAPLAKAMDAFATMMMPQDITAMSSIASDYVPHCEHCGSTVVWDDCGPQLCDPCALALVNPPVASMSSTDAAFADVGFDDVGSYSDAGSLGMAGSEHMDAGFDEFASHSDMANGNGSGVLPAGSIQDEAGDWWSPMETAVAEMMLMFGLAKGLSHKYIKRVPTGNPKRPWRYYYKVTAKGGPHNREDLKLGMSFADAKPGEHKGHWHIVEHKPGESVKIKHDETGEEKVFDRSSPPDAPRDTRTPENRLGEFVHGLHVNNIIAEMKGKQVKAAAEAKEAMVHGSPKTVEAAKKRARKVGVPEREMMTDAERVVADKRHDAYMEREAAERDYSPHKPVVVDTKPVEIAPAEKKDLTAEQMAARGYVWHEALNTKGAKVGYWVLPETVRLVEARGNKWRDDSPASAQKDPFKRWKMKRFDGVPYPYEVPISAVTPGDAFDYAETVDCQARAWQRSPDGSWVEAPANYKPSVDRNSQWTLSRMRNIRMGERPKTGEVFNGRIDNSLISIKTLHANGWIWVPDGIDPNTETRSHAEIIRAKFDKQKMDIEAAAALTKAYNLEAEVQKGKAKEAAWDSYQWPVGAPQPENALHPRLIPALDTSPIQAWTWDPHRQEYRLQGGSNKGSFLQSMTYGNDQMQWQMTTKLYPGTVFLRAGEDPVYPRPEPIKDVVNLGVSVERPPDFLALNMANIATEEVVDGKWRNIVAKGSEKWLHDSGFWQALDKRSAEGEGHKSFAAKILIGMAHKGSTYQSERSESRRNTIASASRNLAAWWSDINDDDREYFWNHFCDHDKQPKVVRPHDPRHHNADFAVPKGMEKFTARGWSFHEYQRKAMNFVADHAKRSLLAMEMGLGKGGRPDDKVLTPTGWRRYGDLAVGDMVIGSQGTAVHVTGVYLRGVLPVYRVAFNDGTDVVVDGDHLWAVRSNNDQHRDKPFRVLETRAIAADLAIANGNLKWRIPLVRPVEFAPSGRLPIDPYLLGVLLGDGALTLEGISFCCGDEATPVEVSKVLPAGMSLVRHDRHDRATNWSIVSSDHGRNSLRDAMIELGLMGLYSHERWIPDSYLYASPNDRLSLLQGLLDTDGEIREKDGHVEFDSSSELLAKHVAFLVQSLGGIARTRIKLTPKYTHAGEARVGRASHRIGISLPSHMRGVRSCKRWVPKTKYEPNRVIQSIDPAGYSEVICIAVDAPDSLYVTEHCIVTHNTLIAIGAFHHLKAKGEVNRMIVTAPTSAHGAWEDDFSGNSDARVVHVSGSLSLEKRKQIYAAFSRREIDVVVMTPDLLKFPKNGELSKLDKKVLERAPQGSFIQTSTGTGYRMVIQHWKRDGDAWVDTYDPGTRLSIDAMAKRKPSVKYEHGKMDWVVSDMDAYHVRKLVDEDPHGIMRVADEVHVYKNDSSQRRVGFNYAMCEPEGRVIGMSGTPKPNGPEDFHTITNDITKGALGGDLKEFAKRYCYESTDPQYGGIMGFRPDALSELYRDNAGFMFTRTTQDPDSKINLPPQNHISPRLKQDDTQVSLQAALVRSMTLLHAALAEERAARAAAAKFGGIEASSPSRMALNDMADGSEGPIAQLAARKVPWDERSLITRLKQASIAPSILDDNKSVTGPGGPLAGYESPKMQAVADAAVTHMTQNPDTGAVLFTTSVGGLYALQEALVRRNVDPKMIGIIHGGISPKKREIIRRALNNGELQYVIGQTKALNTGANMQGRANFVAHLDTPWEPDVLVQSTARVHRQGQRRKVTVFRPMGSDVDTLIERRVAGKLRANSNALGSTMEADRVALASMVGRGLNDGQFTDALASALGISVETLKPTGERVLTGMKEILAGKPDNDGEEGDL